MRLITKSRHWQTDDPFTTTNRLGMTDFRMKVRVGVMMFVAHPQEKIEGRFSVG